MWSFRAILRIDWRLVVIMVVLMIVSLLVISSVTGKVDVFGKSELVSPYVAKQLQFFLLGSVCFLFFSGIDYDKLREWTWIFYALMLLALIGLFFVPSVQGVHRWYRFGPLALQPSEFAKLVVVMGLSWFLDHRAQKISSVSTALLGLLIVFVPFCLIYKQPDLGTALVLFPIALVLFAFGGIKRSIVWIMGGGAFLGFLAMSLFFFGILDHEKLRPLATKVVKEYQYDRLCPHSYHHKASASAIALGGLGGQGWQRGNYSKEGWLPAAHTDSVFPAYAEEFGFVGVVFLLGIFYALVYVCAQVASLAKDRFGSLLALGITAYLVMHLLFNLGMMCGFLPITGIPLPMISSGGSSVLVTMSALGILQSIYSRRFRF